MKTEILSILRECSDYVSGQEISELLGVSRTAIWKAVNGLKEEGYEIESVQNKGYKLISIPETISKNELESRMETKWAGKHVVCFQTIDSTNTEAKRQAEAGAVHGTLIVSQQQQTGKGRRGRSWESPHGTSIYMSILLRPKLKPNQASMLTLVMGLSAAKAIHEITGLKCMIKWPNDLVVNQKKICGILTEMSTEIDFINHVVIGIGINVNNHTFSEEVAKSASSLAVEAGRDFSRSLLIERVMFYFETYYEIFLMSGDLTKLKEEYELYLANKGKKVRVLDPGNEYTGISQGITSIGELLVEKEDGSITHVFSGEVSVRGIYGYV